MKFLAYNSSKTAVNAITVQFAWELRDTTIKVNAADPGYVATDMNRHQGERSVEQGAATPVRLALLPGRRADRRLLQRRRAHALVGSTRVDTRVRSR